MADRPGEPVTRSTWEGWNGVGRTAPREPDREPVTAALVCGFDGDATLRNLLPESRNTLRETLANHYITAIECDHDAKTDTVRCSCSVWTGTPQPSVGASVRQWVDHALAAAAPTPPEDDR